MPDFQLTWLRENAAVSPLVTTLNTREHAVPNIFRGKSTGRPRILLLLTGNAVPIIFDHMQTRGPVGRGGQNFFDLPFFRG